MPPRRSPCRSSKTGPIDLSIKRVTPPTNDDRGHAHSIASLPFEGTYDTSKATAQTVVAVFTGPNLATDVEVLCMEGSSTDFTPVSGTTYYFLVASQYGRSGPTTLDLLPSS